MYLGFISITGRSCLQILTVGTANHLLCNGIHYCAELDPNRKYLCPVYRIAECLLLRGFLSVLQSMDTDVIRTLIIVHFIAGVHHT